MPREYLTVAEVYRMQHRLIELFGGLHGVRDSGAIEAAVFRPQNGYYDSVEEEAAALMESLGMNHGFLGRRRTSIHRRIAGASGVSIREDPRMDSSTREEYGVGLSPLLRLFGNVQQHADACQSDE